MAKASNVTLHIDAIRVPVFEGVLAMASQNRSGGLTSNEEHYARGVDVPDAFNADLAAVLYDPQTSGGLLVAVAEEAASRLEAALTTAGVAAWRVGGVRVGTPGVLVRVTA
jgi:selenide, water dikinase